MFRPRAAAGICGCAGAKRFVEQTQKKGASELSANRGCLLTNRASARNPFGEPNSFRLRNSLRTSVNTKCVFAGEMTPYHRRATFSPAQPWRWLTCSQVARRGFRTGNSQTLRWVVHRWLTAAYRWALFPQATPAAARTSHIKTSVRILHE